MVNLWDRIIYILSPQYEIYRTCSRVVKGIVADVGCGSGFGTHLLALHADSVRAFDIDIGALKFAAQCFPFPNLQFVVRNVTKGLDGLYDYITMIDVIEHIQDDKAAIKNVANHLKKNGIFLCSTPNRLTRRALYPGHLREYSPGEFKKLLETQFSSVDIRNYKLAESKDLKNENPLLAVCGK